MRIFKIKTKLIHKICLENFKKRIQKDVEVFYRYFNKCAKYEERIDLLKTYANKEYNYSFNYLSNRKARTKIKKTRNCSCCLRKNIDTITHHIIQIQNGGINIKKNLIEICRDCHSKIHPWLDNDRTNEYLKRMRKMDEEYRNIVGLDYDNLTN